MCYNKSLW